MRPAFRPFAGLIVVLTAGAGLPLGWLLPGCGTDAVGVEACRQIEAARCSALRSCPVAQGGFKSDDEVDACTLFYRDQCLHGIESTTAPTDAQLTGCVNAVKATAACAKAGTPTMEGCPAAPLVSPMEASGLTPCNAILKAADHLAACNFVDAMPDAGGPPVPDAATDAGDAAASDASAE